MYQSIFLFFPGIFPWRITDTIIRMESPRSSNNIEFVRPEVQRDAPLSLVWLSGQQGKNTLRLMGFPDYESLIPSIQSETERIEDLASSPNRKSWMIQYGENIVGAVWIDFTPIDRLPAPSIHIMIGDTKARGQGIGRDSMESLVDYLRQNDNHAAIYSRHLVENSGAHHLLQNIGFKNLGQPYRDNHGFQWQNVILN